MSLRGIFCVCIFENLIFTIYYNRPLAQLSISLVATEQQLVKDIRCSVIWNETFLKSVDIGAAIAERKLSGMPSMKRRKCESGAHEEGGNNRSCGGQAFVNTGDAICFAMHSDPVPPGSGAVLVVSWTEGTAEGLVKVHSEELSHIKLDGSDLCRGHFDIDKKCLQSWAGRCFLDRCVLVYFFLIFIFIYFFLLGGREIKKAGRSLCVGDFSLSDVQSLVALLGLHMLTQVIRRARTPTHHHYYISQFYLQVHVTSEYTHLWRLPAILKAKFPCSPHSIQVSPSLFAQHHQKSSRNAATAPCHTDIGGLGLLGAIGLHVCIGTGNAVISVLHRLVGWCEIRWSYPLPY